MSSGVPPQQTIRESCVLAGRGLHTGTPARIRCLPAPPGAGITFVLDDVEIPARLAMVVGTHRGVTLGHRGRVVRTVEHLLAAAGGLGIANLRIEVEGEELPALDGSARPIVDALLAAGLAGQDAPWNPIDLAEPVWVNRGDAAVMATPAPALRISYVVATGASAVGVQTIDVEDPARAFAEQIAPARTWGFASEVEALRAEGLARGASEENTLGLGPAGYLWPARFGDEPVRHKVLDLLGDVALLGRPLRAHVMAIAAGHALHIDLARAIEAREPGNTGTREHGPAGGPA